MKEVNNEALRSRLMAESGFLEHFSFDAAAHARLFLVPAGGYIVREDETPQYLYYLARGRAKLYVTLANGKVALIDFFAAPCFVGEMELVDTRRTARAVQAIARCHCLALPLACCRAQLLGDVVFLRRLCAFLSAKNCRNIVSSTQNQAFPLACRLAAFILMSQHGGLYREKHTQAAEYLGVSYRHLLHVLAGFVAEGTLEKQGRAYHIVRPQALQQRAGEMHSQPPLAMLPAGEG